MSRSQVDEWLHADRGSPWKHRAPGGGIIGSPGPSGMAGATGILGPAGMGGPMSSNVLAQRYAQFPVERLQELNAQQPGNPAIQRALAMKQMHVAQAAAQPQAQPMPASGNGILPQQQPQEQQPGILPQQRRGGPIEHRDMGGPLGMSLGMASPWWERSQERGMEDGYLHGSTFGRADHLTTTAPGGSYVVPADVISGIGEGNSLAGASAVQHMLNTGPYGTPLSGGRRGRGPPPAPRAPKGINFNVAKGGGVTPGAPLRGQGQDSGLGQPVPVKLSHGEFVISPQRVLAFGMSLLKKHGGKGHNAKLAMKLGHDFLDEWVKFERKKTASKMLKLPGPAR